MGSPHHAYNFQAGLADIQQISSRIAELSMEVAENTPPRPLRDLRSDEGLWYDWVEEVREEFNETGEGYDSREVQAECYMYRRVVEAVELRWISHKNIPQSLERARSMFSFPIALKCDTRRRLLIFKAMWIFWYLTSWVRDFVRSYDKTPYAILTRPTIIVVRKWTRQYKDTNRAYFHHEDSVLFMKGFPL